MSFDDHIRAALAGASDSLRQHLEADLGAVGQEIARAAGEERRLAEAAAAEAAASDVRREAEAQLASVRDAAQTHVEELKRAADAEIADLRTRSQQRLEASQKDAEESSQKHAEQVKRVADDEIARLHEALADLRTQSHNQLDATQKHAEEFKRGAEAQVADLQRAAYDLRSQTQQQVEASQKYADDYRRTAEGQIAGLHTTLEDVRAQAQQQFEAAQKHAEELKGNSEAQVGELRKALGDLRAQAQQQLETARRIAQAEVDRVRDEVEQTRAEMTDARGESEMLRGEAEQARGHARAEIARAQVEVERLRRIAAAEAEEVVFTKTSAARAANEQKLAVALDGARTDCHQSELERAARLAESIRSLDEARGLSDVLERLASCAGQEVDRAAVLIVKADRLAGWALAGFGAVLSAKSIDLSLLEAGLPGAVVTSGVAASCPANGASRNGHSEVPLFARDAAVRHAMALPVHVGGEVVAVLYADAPRPDAPSSAARWPAVLEVLVRHASRALEALTVHQAAGLSRPHPMARGPRAALPGPIEKAGTEDEAAARRYARLLLSEIRMYHEPTVDEGRRSGDLLVRLHGEIDRARRLYDAHVPPTLQAREEYFDQELVRTLADDDRTLLGSAR